MSGIFSFLKSNHLGSYLVRKGIIREEQLENAFATQRKSGSHLNFILQDLGYITKDDIPHFHRLSWLESANSFLFYFILLQIPLIAYLALSFTSWNLALAGLAFILGISAMIRFFFPDHNLTPFVHTMLILALAYLIIEITGRDNLAHLFLLIMPGVLLIYRQKYLFVLSGLIIILYYLGAWLLQDNVLIAFPKAIPLSIALAYSVVSLFQSVLLLLLAAWLHKEDEEKNELTFTVDACQDEFRKERLKFAITDISQIMYLHTIAEGVKQATNTITQNTGKVASQSQKQVVQVNEITDTIKNEIRFFKEMEQETSQTSKITQATVDVATQGQQEVLHTIDVMRRIVNISNDTTRMMSGLGDSSKKIGDIIKVIDDIAAQTNLLALNAAIEAARAGEGGRGFAVVANEVGKLSDLTQKATNDISSTITLIQKEIKSAIDKVSSETEETRKGIDVAQRAGSALENIMTSIHNINDHVGNIAGISRKQASYIEKITDDLNTVYIIVVQSDNFVNNISSQLSELSLEADNINKIIKIFQLDRAIQEQNQKILAIAQDFSRECMRIFEDSIDNGIISEVDLFDRDYKPIPNTDPQKFNTKYDRFTDKYILDLEERYLVQDENIRFLVIVDDNGFLPTHNVKFSQPLTGNKEVDLIRNRTKRLFNDRTGLKAARNRDSYLLQTYLRDTGQFMNDLSMPLTVKGRRWGAVRIGFTYSQKLLLEGN